MVWAEINGAVMRYEVQGQGAPLVLVHEMGGTLNSYDEVVADLARRYRVVRYDLRGAGLSEKVQGRLDIDLLAEDIAALLDHVGIDAPVALAGTAVGAAIALRFARRHPVRAAAAVGFSPVTACLPENRAGVLAHADRIETEGLRALAPVSIPAILPESLRVDLSAFEAARCRWLANDPRGYAAIYRMYAHLDMSDEYARIATPCLMVGATHDTLRPPAVVKAVAGALPQGHYLELETGHVAAVQTPDLFVRALCDFLASVGHGCAKTPAPAAIRL